MRLLGSLIILSIWQSMAFATSDVVAIISGPEKVSVGELVVLRCGTAGSDSASWVILDQKGREAEEVRLDAIGNASMNALRYLVVDNGKAVVFSSPSAGRFFVVLIVVQVSEDGAVSRATTRHIVQVGDNGPGPKPPDPDPTPLTGMAKVAYDTAIAKVAAGSRVNARKSAAAFRAVASMIAAGTIKSAQEVIRETSAQRKTQLGADADNWNDWATEIGAKLNDLSKDGSLKTLDDHATVWLQIAQGLEAVR